MYYGGFFFFLVVGNKNLVFFYFVECYRWSKLFLKISFKCISKIISFYNTKSRHKIILRNTISRKLFVGMFCQLYRYPNGKEEKLNLFYDSFSLITKRSIHYFKKLLLVLLYEL